MLADAKLGGEYLGGYQVPVEEGCHSVHNEDTKTNEERGGQTHPPKLDCDGRVISRRLLFLRVPFFNILSYRSFPVEVLDYFFI